MKCNKAERLLALLGRGDLESRNARALQEHLTGCASCTESAHDYQRLFDLLHSTAAVDFDEGFFGRIRRSVLSEIRLRENRWPTPLLWWHVKPVTVLGTAAVMIALGVGLALLSRGLVRHNGEGVAISSKDLQSSQAVPTTNDAVKADATNQPAVVKSQKDAWNRLSRKGRSVTASQVGGLVAKRKDKVRLEEKPQTEQKNLEVSAQLPSTPPRHEASRIEILTADPNIRIIWLAAKTTN